MVCSKSCYIRTELFMGVCFGIWNNVTTVLNAHSLYERQHRGFAMLIIFFLMFPGLVTSVGFLILHWFGHRRFGKMPPGSVLLYFLLFLFFYPVVPIAL